MELQRKVPGNGKISTLRNFGFALFVGISNNTIYSYCCSLLSTINRVYSVFHFIFLFLVLHVLVSFSSFISLLEFYLEAVE